MYCDSAYQYDKKNEIEAFGNVHIISADTIHIYSDYLKYKGDSRKAILKNNITLKIRMSY